MCCLPSSSNSVGGSRSDSGGSAVAIAVVVDRIRVALFRILLLVSAIKLGVRVGVSN